MDFYLNSRNSFNRLLEEYNTHQSIVVAFDFDDTVYDFHKKGRLYNDVIELLRKLKSINCYLICWTGQQDLDFVSNYLTNNNIPFDAINENPPFYKSTSKKIYANAYLDDRAGLKEVYEMLTELVLRTENIDNYTKLETISNKIHQFWMMWATELIKSEPNLSNERIKRWQNECFLDYKNLSEDMKELDRKFAREIIRLK